jgi:cytochrome b561
MILRLLWRLANTVPQLPVNIPGHIQRLAHLSHWLFYILLLSIPVAGWINSSASNLTVSWFGIFNWPDLVDPDKQIATIAKQTHKILVWTLLAIISVHTIAALRHHFVLKDSVLIRMLPGLKSNQIK